MDHVETVAIVTLRGNQVQAGQVEAKNEEKETYSVSAVAAK